MGFAILGAQDELPFKNTLRRGFTKGFQFTIIVTIGRSLRLLEGLFFLLSHWFYSCSLHPNLLQHIRTYLMACFVPHYGTSKLTFRSCEQRNNLHKQHSTSAIVRWGVFFCSKAENDRPSK